MKQHLVSNPPKKILHFFLKQLLGPFFSMNLEVAIIKQKPPNLGYYF